MCSFDEPPIQISSTCTRDQVYRPKVPSALVPACPSSHRHFTHQGGSARGRFKGDMLMVSLKLMAGAVRDMVEIW